MDTASHSISPEELAAVLGGAAAPLVLDVRRDERFVESDRMLPGARRCPPEHVGRFAASRSLREAVVYCVHGETVLEEAKRLGAVAYDIAGASITHDGEFCSFDALLRAFDLQEPALLALARIVRGADTDRLQLTPQSAGLLAVSRGLSRLYANDHSMLDAALPVYDALYAWCRSEGRGA